MLARKPNCWVCHRTDFKTWDEVYQHMVEKSKIKGGDHAKSRSAQQWMKKYRHRGAIKKLKSIGQKKEFEPRQALTPEQLQAKHEAKYTLSKKTTDVQVICPRCKKKTNIYGLPRIESLEIEHVNNPDALKIDNCFVKLCEGCR